MSPGSAGRPALLGWTDGGCRGNPGPGGWGFLLVHLPTGTSLEARGGEPHTTNNRMEITAALELLRSLKRPSSVEIRSDSRYLVDLATRWLEGWKRRGWKRARGEPVENLDLVKELDALLARHRVSWRWVRGHAGEPGNEYVDALANAAMDAVQRGEDPAFRRRLPASPVPLS